jgi:hypothetical protein
VLKSHDFSYHVLGCPGLSHPLPPNDLRKWQKLAFSSGARPPPPILLAGGGGGRSENMLDVRVGLAFRQLLALAESPAIDSGQVRLSQ